MLTQYTIEFAINLFLFYCAYTCFLKHSRDFTFRRLTILVSVFLSMLIPLLPHLGMSQAVFGVTLEPISITAKGVNSVLSHSTESLSLDLMVTSIYWAGCMYFVLRTLAGLVFLRKLYMQGQKCREGNSTIVVSSSVVAPFSFFRVIYLPSTLNAQSAQFSTILLHEVSHSNFRHSLDKLAMQFVTILFWWHPAVHLFLKELALVHEYQVDECIIAADTSPKNYIDVLVKQSTFHPQYTFISTISSHLKNRIVMMYQKKSKENRALRPLAFLVLIVALAGIHACQNSNINGIPPTPPSAPIPPTPPTAPLDGDNVYIQPLTDTIITFDPETQKESVQYIRSEMTVLKSPEQLPMFPGCSDVTNLDEKSDCSQKKLFEYIFTNIKYPESARVAGLEGMVVVKFIVDKDGIPMVEEIKKSLSPDCDNEVLNLIAAMRGKNIRFEPGMQDGKPVHVEINLPVKFKLEG